MKAQKVKLPTFDDKQKGVLSVVEAHKELPFIPMNCHWMTRLGASEERGGHAHKTLSQVIFCLQGSFRLTLDNGKEVQQFWLSSPSEGVLIPPLHWDTLDSFSKNCVILSIADNFYDNEEYIHDYEEFLKLIKEKENGSSSNRSMWCSTRSQN